MKRISSLVAMFSVLFSFGQNSAISDAQLSREAKEWPDAKSSIDKASKHEKTINEPKTWYYRGVIYSDIFGSTEPAVKMLCDSANEVAINSFLKAKELENDPKGVYTKKMKADLENLWILSTNEGVKNFNAKNIKQAKKDFMVAAKANPKDTVAPSNVLAACGQLKDTLCLIDGYTAKKNQGKDTPELYFWTFLYYQKRDTAKAIKALADGSSKFPSNENFNNMYIDMLFAHKQYSKAQGKLVEYAKTHPSDKLCRLRLAAIYEESQDNENAIKQYEEVLALDPNNLTAMYNLGVLRYKLALKYNTDKDALKPEERATKGKELEDKYKKTLYDASKPFEEYRKVRPNDDQVKSVLKDIYKRLKRDDLLQMVK